MNRLRTVATRVAIIAAAACLCIELSSAYAHSIQAPPKRRLELRGLHRGPPKPNLKAMPQFTVRCVLFAVITLVGNKVLGLRLSD
jgi:hypothetical protein